MISLFDYAMSYDRIDFRKERLEPALWPTGEVHTLYFCGPGFAGLDPGRRPTHRSSSHAVVASHIEEYDDLRLGYTAMYWGFKIGNRC